jgi:PAS domain S-box-containing protein
VPGASHGKDAQIQQVHPVRPGKAKLQALTKQANQRSKEDWEKTFNAISDWVAITDLKGRILRTNTAAEKFTGVPMSEIVGQSCCKLVHGSEKPIPCCPLQKMLHTRQREIAELKVPDADRWLMVTIDQVTDQAGNLVGAVHIMRDITEHKQAEKALAESEKKLKSIFEHANDGIIYLDGEGTILDVNKRAAQIFGGSKKEVLNKHFTELDIFSANEIPVLTSNFEAILAGSEPTVTVPIKNKKGRQFILECSASLTESDGNTRNIMVIARDITERKRAEEERDQVLNQQDAIIKNVPGWAFLKDTEGRYIAANRAFFDLLPASVDDPIGKRDRDFFTKDVADILEGEDNEVLKKGLRIKRERPVRLKDGHVAYMMISLAPVLDDLSNVVGLVAVAVDITERKQAEEKIKNLAKFPEENSNPVHRTSKDGVLLYANPASRRLILEDQTKIGDKIPEKWIGMIKKVYDSGKKQQAEMELSGRVFLFDLVPVIEGGYVNSYGTDITEHKKAEQNLARALAWQEAIFEGSRDAVFITDEDSRFVAVNRAACELTAYTKDDLLKMRIPDLHAEEDLTAYKLFHGRIMAGEDIVSEAKIRRKGGSKVDTEFNNRYIKISDSAYMHTVARDVSERKRVEQALRESEEKYRDLFENARDTIVTTDVEAKITGVNKVVEEYGFKKEQLVGKSIFDFIVEQQKERGLKDFKTAISGNPVRGEMEVITPRGIFTAEYIDNPIKRAGEIIGIQAVLRDITERKRAERLLRKERDRAQKYLDVAGVMLVAVDSEQRVGLINKKGCEILGYKEEEILGKNWFNNFLPERVQREVQAIFQRLMCQQEWTVPERHENPILTKSGDERLMAWHNTVLRDGAGKVIAALGSGEDITEQRKAEQKSLQYQSQLRSVASQLTVAEERERHRIATELHDQIAQLLAISKIKLDALRHSMRRGEPVKVLEDVCNALGQAIAQTRSLTFDLSSPILHQIGFEAAVAAWLTEQIEAKHRIRTEFQDDGQPKPLDDDVLAILFRNVRELLINIVKHAKAHNVKVFVQKIGNEIQVSVEDDGIGFEPAEVLAKAARERKFGLFSVREHLEQLGGRLEIESKPGHGCRAMMTAPLKQEEG